MGIITVFFVSICIFVPAAIYEGLRVVWYKLTDAWQWHKEKRLYYPKRRWYA